MIQDCEYLWNDESMLYLIKETHVINTIYLSRFNSNGTFYIDVNIIGMPDNSINNYTLSDSAFLYVYRLEQYDFVEHFIT